MFLIRLLFVIFIHLTFIVLHLLAILFSPWLMMLVVTIPLHIIVIVMLGNGAKIRQQTKLLKEQNELVKRGRDRLS